VLSVAHDLSLEHSCPVGQRGAQYVSPPNCAQTDPAPQSESVTHATHDEDAAPPPFAAPLPEPDAPGELPLGPPLPLDESPLAPVFDPPHATISENKVPRTMRRATFIRMTPQCGCTGDVRRSRR
jgi:hypothetical protein